MLAEETALQAAESAAIAAYFDRPEGEAGEVFEAPDATRLYLKEIGGAPLLTPAEEVRFARPAAERPRGGNA